MHKNIVIQQVEVFRKLSDLYQSDGIPKGISIVQFCKMNGIVYSHFECWYKKDRIANVVPVEIVNRCDLCTFIETVKLNDLSPMNYLTHVFRQLMEGNKDYESLLPGKLAFQTL